MVGQGAPAIREPLKGHASRCLLCSDCDTFRCHTCFSLLGKWLIYKGIGFENPEFESHRFRQMNEGLNQSGPLSFRWSSGYHAPTFGIDAQGSALGSGSPICSNSIEIWSGERTNAIRPSRGGRLIVTP